MDKILSSAMAQEEISKKEARMSEIAESINEAKEKFEESSVDEREEILKSVEELKEEAKQMEKEINELNEVKDTLNDQEERMSLLNNVSTPKVEERKSFVATDTNDTPEFRHAFADAIRNGTRVSRDAFSTSDAAPVIPTIMQREIEVAWDDADNDEIIDLVSISNVNSIYAVPIEVSATGAVWHNENGDPVDPETITMGQLLLQPQFVKKYLPITDELLLMTDSEFLRYVGREMTYRVKKQLADSIITRPSATIGVRGIVEEVAKNVAPSGSPAVTLGTTITQNLTFNTANIGVAELATSSNLTVVMNKATFFKDVMGMTDLQERPLWSVVLDNANKPRYYFNGLPVRFSDALAAYDESSTTSKPYMIVGNFKGYKLNLPWGRAVDILRDPYTLSTSDQERFVAKLPAAGGITRLGHFVVFKNVKA